MIELQTISFAQRSNQSSVQTLFRHSNSLCTHSNPAQGKPLYPEQIPLALAQKHLPPSPHHRTFFGKNRKVRTAKQQRPVEQFQSPIVPEKFSSLLRAKSTVVKQKKHQEFYINRQSLDSQKLFQQEFRSNLFKPNIPKKTNQRRHSLGMEKPSRFSKPKSSTPALELVTDQVKISMSATTKTKKVPFQCSTQGISCPLQERETNKDNFDRKNWLSGLADTHSCFKESNLLRRDRPVRKKHLHDKENIEFDLEPWGHHEQEDPFF